MLGQPVGSTCNGATHPVGDGQKPTLCAAVSRGKTQTVGAFLHYDVIPWEHHTMGSSLDVYVEQRMPTMALEEAARKHHRIEVYGMPPDLIENADVAATLGLDSGQLKKIDYDYMRWPRGQTSGRPVFYKISGESDERNGTRIILAVNTGFAYLAHYVSMVRHFLATRGQSDPAKLMLVHTYPELEARRHEWTGLDEAMVRRGDLIIIGYTKVLRAYLKATGEITESVPVANHFYTSIRWIVNGRALNFFEPTHLHWGDLQRPLVRRLAELGATEVIYMAKCATLESPEEIYDRIYCPASYVVSKGTAVCEHVNLTDVPNGILEVLPELATGPHVSVPTILEESYDLRDVTAKLGAASLDNEVSCMASELADWNRHAGTDVTRVKYTALHFATDYLRTRDEREMDVAFDLANNREQHAEKHRAFMLDAICEVLDRYFRR